MERDYAYTRTFTSRAFADVVAKTREALAAEGFGVLTEIDVKATLEKKLGVQRRPYLILGACNPSLAHQALEAEPSIGVFLPCNVDVFEGDDGTVYLQSVNPIAMFSLVKNPGVEPIAEQVAAKLQRALASV